MANPLRTGDTSLVVQIVPRSSLAEEAPPPHVLAYRTGQDRSAERLFQALEGSEVLIGSHRAPITVYSVTDLPSGRWVQLGLEGEHHQHLITLSLREHSSVQDVAAALSAWFADPAHTEDLLDVA